MSPLEELDKLTSMLRKRIKCNARKCARIMKKSGLGLETCSVTYLKRMKTSPEYPNLEKAIEGIITDCIDNYKMERWWAESAMGFNIDKELIDAFIEAWEKAPDVADEADDK